MLALLWLLSEKPLQRFRPSGYDKVAEPAQHRETGVSKLCATLFRPSGYDKVAEPAQHRETGVSKLCATLFQIYFRIHKFEIPGVPYIRIRR